MNLVKKICNVLVAMAVLVAPTASGFCRTFFFEEKEPEGLLEFGKKRK